MNCTPEMFAARSDAGRTADRFHHVGFVVTLIAPLSEASAALSAERAGLKFGMILCKRLVSHSSFRR
jgi:hypothetical protein